MSPAANPFGLDVSWLDVPAFIATSQIVYALVAILWLLLALRLRRPGLLFAGVLAANAWVWFVTNFPLQSLYGVLTSSDRLNNLGFCTVVAAGNSPLQTQQVGEVHFEPFWALLVATLSGWNPDRALAVYPFLSLVMALGFATSLFLALRLPGVGGAWGPWERVLIAGFATLLSSSPFEYLGTYRNPWALTFLLKPNHALGLVIFPIFLHVFARMRSWQARIAAGFLLHLVAWAFVLHMAFVCVGLLGFVGVSLAYRREELWPALRDVAVVIGVNVAIVSPYLYMLITGYPIPASPNLVVPVISFHLVEPIAQHLPLSLLGLWGAVVAFRRGDRLGRVWAGQVLGALLVWAGHILLSFLHLSRERDEAYYWLRFILAASAGIGVWDLGVRLAPRLWRGFREQARLCAGILLLALPYSLPYWWNPLVMDSYFPASLAPLPERLAVPTAWIRHSTDPRGVFAGDMYYARYVAALGSRRVLKSVSMSWPHDMARRSEFEAMLAGGGSQQTVREMARNWGVSHLIVTPYWLSRYPGVDLGALDAGGLLRRVFLWRDDGGDFIAIYELADSET